MSRVEKDEDVKNPGDYFVRVLRDDDGDTIASGINFCCPSCGLDCYIPIIKGDHPETSFESKFWMWDGNEDAPTTTPSIANRCCGWHGYMTNGEFVPC